MAKNICCGDCGHYSPNSNINQSHGICKEYEALVNYSHIICGWYCKRNGGREKTTAKEYIEREEVRDAFYMEFDEDYADDIVDRLPTSDVQEVVRCKDCSYFCKATVNKKGFFICPASGMEITDNDFCSYGERKGDNSNEEVGQERG